jgi:hypothetical protein
MTARARPALLGTVRGAGLVVGVLAATVGITYAIAAIIGPQVLWLIDDPTGAGSNLVHLRLELRLVHAATVVVAAATVAAIALLLAELARHVWRGVEFVPAVSRTAWSIAVVLAVGSWLAQFGENVALRAGVRYPDTGDPATMDPAALPLYWEIGPASFLPDLPFLGLALALALLASIIQAGERLQRDQEGLV